jgi:hypothetical protein
VDVPVIQKMNLSTFRTGDFKNTPTFIDNSAKKARIGVFACKKDKVERAAILLLPETGVPDRLIVGITHTFKPQTKFFDRLGFANPLSPALIKDVARRFVLFRWGAQILESNKRGKMALLLPVRAKGDELGPFANDGKFVKHVLTAIAGLTNGAFVPRHIEAFTFSSGITDLNRLNIEAIYNQDPAPLISARRVRGAVRRQFASGVTGPFVPGFEPLPLARWKNELLFSPLKRPGVNDSLYLHDNCIALYTLFLGIETS